MNNLDSKAKTGSTPHKKHNILQIIGWIIVGYGATILLLDIFRNMSEFRAHPTDFQQILFETVFYSMPILLIGGFLVLLSAHKNSNRITKILSYVLGIPLVLIGLYFLYIIYAISHLQF